MNVVLLRVGRLVVGSTTATLWEVSDLSDVQLDRPDHSKPTNR